MSSACIVRHLRPHLSSRYWHLQCLRVARRQLSTSALDDVRDDVNNATNDYEKRVAQLGGRDALATCYPRLGTSIAASRVKQEKLRVDHGHLEPGQTDDGRKVALAGRVRSVRISGSKLCFVDVETEDSGTVQAVCQLSKLDATNSGFDAGRFKAFAKLARKGDSCLINGHPHRTSRGELSILATELPQLLSPSLHQVPTALEDAEARARHRHVDMLVNPLAIRTLRVRHHIEQSMQDYLNGRGFVKVTTPILSAEAGGANARAFETKAVELADDRLNLRIAPELWLKRLIVGGMEKVYEIGPSFRNEGVDHTHNPEFSTCEFYQAYATLDDLMGTTEDLLRCVWEKLTPLPLRDEVPTPLPNFGHGEPFQRIEFIPGLEEQLGRKLPDLESPLAVASLTSILEAQNTGVPSPPTVPRLLDALASHFLEPMSCPNTPLFITHHPAATSPLSKHFRCPRTGQLVAARAELFIGGREYANMYEEENSPVEQRAKFEAQARLRDGDDEAMSLDESYLRALEWGMPPTGGWGCGLDRLVMLFAGRERIADVLSFGTLRNVAGLNNVDRR